MVSSTEVLTVAAPFWAAELAACGWPTSAAGVASPWADALDAEFNDVAATGVE
jgi:hypothetical protein